MWIFLKVFNVRKILEETVSLPREGSLGGEPVLEKVATALLILGVRFKVSPPAFEARLESLRPIRKTSLKILNIE